MSQQGRSKFIFCDFSLNIYTLLCLSVTVSAIPSICDSVCHVNINATDLAVFCSSPKLTLQGRCCVNESEIDQFDIIGIDLQNCSMTQTKFSNGINGINTLRYISLEYNDDILALNNTDFHRNTDIKNLSLPVYLECPGGQKAWSKNVTEGPVRKCFEEKNPCVAENLTCPLNSHCVHSGIDLTECLCDEDYHGYKCMNKGKFPTVPFAIGISASTVVASFFLWFTQRRYVKSHPKKN
ncbi:hypothetical protein Btru_065275 [Bulinus truncatus]|nr:hypothetical protein Btru_065275 [Bulinus truncatus]